MSGTTSDILGTNTDDWPEIAIIILNWNNYEDSAECLESLKEVEYSNHRVIVVDNGSTDGSGDRLADEYDWCEFVFNETNRGFPGGVNVGIRAAQKHDTDYVLLLNNDAVIDANALREMVSVGESNDDAGIVSSLILDYDDEIVHDAGREFVFHTLEYENPYQGRSESSLAGTHEVEGISGCCMMVKSELINQIGVLNDEQFFFGGEDIDYCLRAKNAGWRIIVQLDAPVYHKVNSTAGSDSEFKEYHQTRNKLWMGYSYGGLVGIVGIARKSLRNLRRVVALLLNGDGGRPTAIFKAYADFIMSAITDKVDQQPSKENLLKNNK